MKRLIRLWNAAWDDLAAGLEHRAATARTGVTLIEATAADDFEMQLARVAAPGTAHEFREIALDAAKLGLNAHTAREAFKQWFTAPYRVRHELGLIRHYIDGRIEANE